MIYYQHTWLSGALNGLGLMIALTSFMRPMLAALGFVFPIYFSLIGLILLFVSYQLAHKRTRPKLSESVLKAEGLNKYGYFFMACIVSFAMLAFYPLGQDVMKSAWTTVGAVLFYCGWIYGRYHYRKAYEVVVRKQEVATVF